MKSKIIVFTLCLIVTTFIVAKNLLAIQTSYAGNYVQPETQSGFYSERYEAKAGQKLERGVQNFFLGWLELFQGVKMEYYYREQAYLPTGIETFFVGLSKGVFSTVGRTAVGFYEMFTFPYAQEPILEEMDEWLY